jgi:serpin B
MRRRRRRSIALGWALTVPLLAACGTRPQGTEPATVPPPAAPVQTPEVSPPAPVAAPGEEQAAAFAASTRGLAAALFRELPASGNLAVSPVSLSMALGMTYAGARGETASEMAAAMRFGDDPEGLHRAAHAQLARWEGVDGLTVRAANRLYPKRALQLAPPFVALTRDAYLAAPEPLDFGASEAARQTINAWVSERTEARIEDLIPAGALTSDTSLVLVNALYFLGTWAQAFDEEATRPRPFFRSPEDPVDTPTMTRTLEDVAFAQVPGARLVALPYADPTFDMVLVVPEEVDGLSAVEARLDELAGWMEGMRPRREVRVFLPRFRLDPPASIALRDPLRALGMERAFRPGQADFTGIADPEDEAERLHVSEVFHQVFVEVDEQGTEAAGATAVVIVRTGGRPEPPPPTVRADRPFLFVLRDRQTGAWLFLGRVADPTAS